ncbi:unnamed protein product [Ilex paraguariensis]|uniref:Uncharacterized protein n=1 Tax=Ilex paraguariensis TaxID=185542 RepID=A0ABC8TC06_9AQUA
MKTELEHYRTEDIYVNSRAIQTLKEAFQKIAVNQRTPRRINGKNIMVAVKGKHNSLTNRVAQDHGTIKNVGVRSIKIYAENEKVKICGRDFVNAECKRKSAPLNNSISQADASGLKVGPKNSERSKGKHGSVKINVGRRVLADVSNVWGNISRNELHDGSKPAKYKSERTTILTRPSLGPVTRTISSSSSKPLMGKLRANQSQAIGGQYTLKKVASKDLKICSDDLRIKDPGRTSVNTFGRTSERNPLPPTRKSLSVIKQVNQVVTSDANKEKNAENSEKNKGRRGFSAKPKVGWNAAPRTSNPQSQLWRTRVSDGFIIMASKGEPKVDARALSIKSMKPAVKTMVTISNTRRTSKSKGTSGLNKSTSGAALSSKRKQNMATSSLSQHRAAIFPHEQPAREELTSDKSSNLGTTASDIFPGRKSDRRKSYTSTLMARSKLLKENGELLKQEMLPNIYDDSNHLEVAEYVDDIYQYYWVIEAQNQSLKSYMEIQTDITPQMRGILINWLIEVHLKFDLMQETLFLMVRLLDQYLSLVRVKKSEMQLVGLTALLLASKYEDFWHPRVVDLISISAESYTRDQMLGMEKAILKMLKFRLNAPTPYVFLLRLIKAAESDKKLEHLAFYLIELCLVEYEALKFKPSLLCASAIYVARCTLQRTPPWTPLLGKHARYEESQIRECAEMILKFHKAAETAILKVTHDKYSSQDYSRAAAVRPLDRLPL